MNDKLKLATYNARGLKNDTKRHNVFNYLKEKQYDIVFLQTNQTTQILMMLK